MLNPPASEITELHASDAVPPELALLLAAAAAPASPAELAGEHEAAMAFTAARQVPLAGRPRRILARRGALAAAAAFGLLGVSGAAAAAGVLPDAAQDVAHTTLTKVGVDVPQGKGRATAPGQLKKAGQPATPKADKPAKSGGEEPQGEHPDNKGKTISSIARDPNLHGREKGAAVSDAASGGKSHAGDQNPTSPQAQPAAPSATSPSATSPGVTAPGRAKAP